MTIFRLLVLGCALVASANILTARAEDNPAQSAARDALIKKLSEASAQPAVANITTTPSATAAPIKPASQPEAKAVEAGAEPEVNQSPADLQAKPEPDKILAAPKTLETNTAAIQTPPNRPLSLRDCVDLTLSRNLNLQIEHLRVEIAGDVLNSAYGAYDPTFTFGAVHRYESALGGYDTQKYNPDMPAEITTERLGPELGGNLPFGFNYDFLGGVSKNAAVTDFRTDPQHANDFSGGIRSTNDATAAAGVTMRQHLLKDFWIDSDREQLLIRRADLKVSQQALRFQIMQALLAVDLAYYDLIAAREEIQVQEKAVALRQQSLADTKRRIELGEAPALDSAQAETQLQNALTALAAARELFSTRQNRLIGLLTDDFKSWANADIQLKDALEAFPVEVNRSSSFQSAMANRPDLAEARLAVEKTGVLVKFRFNQLFPSLDVVGGYGGVGRETDPSTAIHEAFSFRNPESSYGVVLSFPLSNVSERNNYRASKAAKKIAELQLQQAEQDVLIYVADCITRVQSSFSQVTSTRKAAAYAATALQAEKQKLQNGSTTSFAVLQYEEILTAARTAEVRAAVDYNRALAQLAFAEGTIIERHHLSLEVK